MSVKNVTLSSGVEGLFIENQRFNTTLISFNFYMPLEKKRVAANALLPFILTSCSKAYPDFSRLNYKLNKLYGARLDASAEKNGDYQLLKMNISVINDRFSIDGESLIKQATDLLLGLIFEPNTENGAFLDTDLEREKRKAIEHIKGEFSEKRIYAKNRLIEEMYRGKVYGIPKCGTVSDVEAITGQSLYEAWEHLLKTAFVRVHVVGAALPAGLFEEVSDRFAKIERLDVVNCKGSRVTEFALEPYKVTECDDIAQGKLCMGFSCEMSGNDDESLPMMVMSDIFGGGPYSRLFANVREKMSLCYYCTASCIRQKGLLIVESGVEAQNCEKAQKEILNQLEIVKKGEFSDFEFESSIKSICDSLNTYNDSLTSLNNWYAIKINNTKLYSPSDIAEKIKKITKQDVIDAANGVNLHTVYKLVPKEVG